MGGWVDDKGMKTKVRRLYDIAYVLTSLKLIEKIQVGGWVVEEEKAVGTSYWTLWVGG